jgi:hypothetical protein
MDKAETRAQHIDHELQAAETEKVPGPFSVPRDIWLKTGEGTYNGPASQRCWQLGLDIQPGEVSE